MLYDDTESGAARGIRTLGLNLGKVTLFRLSYCRIVPPRCMRAGRKNDDLLADALSSRPRRRSCDEPSTRLGIRLSHPTINMRMKLQHPHQFVKRFLHYLVRIPLKSWLSVICVLIF